MEARLHGEITPLLMVSFDQFLQKFTDVCACACVCIHVCCVCAQICVHTEVTLGVFIYLLSTYAFFFMPNAVYLKEG